MAPSFKITKNSASNIVQYKCESIFSNVFVVLANHDIDNNNNNNNYYYYYKIHQIQSGTNLLFWLLSGLLPRPGEKAWFFKTRARGIMGNKSLEI